MKFLVLPLLALLLLLTGCNEDPNLPTVVQMPPVGGPASASDIIYVGDKLEVYILEDEGFNGIYTVRDGGHIIFPKVGRVLVAGKSLADAEATIRTTFQQSQLTKATVILERHGARRQGPSAPTSVTVYLSGQVNRPGVVQVPFIGGLRPTALQAIVQGGGMADFSKPSGAYLIRNQVGSQERINLNLDKIGKGSSQDVPLQDGDIIVVPQRGLFGF